MSITFNELHELFVINSDKSIRKLHSLYKNLHGDIYNCTSFLDPDNSLYARIYCVLHNITTAPMCGTCKSELTYVNSAVGFRKFCSSKCSNNNEQTKEAFESTMVQRYGVASSNYIEDSNNKRKATNINKYGCEYTCQSESTKRKRETTNIAKYGHEHPWRNSEVRNKIKITNGVDNPSQLHIDPNSLTKLYDIEWIKDQHYIQCKSLTAIAEQLGISATAVKYRLDAHNLQTSTVYKSQPEQDIYDFIRETVNPLYQVLRSNRSILGGPELDIVIPELNIAIEYNGTFWHSELSGKGRQYHRNKTFDCYERNIRLIHVFEHDWINNQQIVKDRIKTLLFAASQRIYARNTTITQITNKQCTDFLKRNHIHHNVRGAKVSYALSSNDELLMVMSFGKPRYNKQAEWELLRLASKSDVQIVGGASKLFKHFIRSADPQSIVSYQDLNWGFSNVYQLIGMSYDGITPPSYQYFHKSAPLTLYHRSTFQKHKLKSKLDVFDSDVSEWENMKKNGYNRIWNCGNVKFIWTR